MFSINIRYALFDYLTLAGSHPILYTTNNYLRVVLFIGLTTTGPPVVEENFKFIFHAGRFGLLASESHDGSQGKLKYF